MEEPLPSVIPSATYRLQFQPAFPLEAAIPLVAYLRDLGITHLYSSPLLASRKESIHGYDIVEHERINPELGGMESLERLVRTLQQDGMSMILDVVPNHMCVLSAENKWWQDVLENGPSSRYANYFDIDWNPPKVDLRDKVLLPQLGDQFGRVLERREIQVVFEKGSFFLSHHQALFPLAPRSWRLVLKEVRDEIYRQWGGEHADVQELESILTALDHLPLRTESDPEKLRERRREKEIIKRRLFALAEANSVFFELLQKKINRLNGEIGNPASFNELEALIADQAYRLSYWRVAADEINYRRFFDINDLAALRVEDPEVFQATHGLVLELVRRGWISGLRIDHPDGLFEPAEYFRRVQQSCLQACGERGRDTGEDLRSAFPGPSKSTRPDRFFFLVAEKILLGNEELNPLWQIEGTTGYGFLNFLNGIFVDTSCRTAFLRLYRRFTSISKSFRELVYESKRLILKVSMSSELNVLARKLDRISEQHRWSRDFTLENLRDALAEVIACFPVYRTYTDFHAESVDPADQRHIQHAIEEAKRVNPAISESVFDVIQEVLLMKDPPSLTVEQRAERKMFIMRLQQFTGPVMAKGLEDTAFYRYYPLLSLNEVGGAPEQFGISPAFFHKKNRIRLRDWPHAMLTTSTHDSKRSEDVRARINVLSEIPVLWAEKIRRWQLWNQAYKTRIRGEDAPDANEEYLIYQTLLGIWRPDFRDREARATLLERITGFLMKAIREAKIHSSWVNPQIRYEEAASRFVQGILANECSNPFPEDFALFAQPVIRAGWANSLSQMLLKITSPGIPDFYQGCETWNFSLVDPDNRQVVDFSRLRNLFNRTGPSNVPLSIELFRQMVDEPEDGALKFYLIQRALNFRKAHSSLFLYGEYLPIYGRGEKHRHVIAFARRQGPDQILVVCGRFFFSLLGRNTLRLGREVWEDAHLILRRNWAPLLWKDLLTGRDINPTSCEGKWILPLAGVLDELPVALLYARNEAITPGGTNPMVSTGDLSFSLQRSDEPAENAT